MIDIDRINYIMCGPAAYGAYKRELGEVIWSDIFKKARRQLSRIGA